MLGRIKAISHKTIYRFGASTGRSLHITGAACLGNMSVGIAKLIMGILSLSLFTCASALYTFGMVTAKCIALAGIVKEENYKTQYKYYRASALILIGSSMLYIVYSIRLFIQPVNESYHMYYALCIATFTFAELGINIKGLIVQRHKHSPLIHAIRMINLASSLICLVLTQSAILSFADVNTREHPGANGFMGILMGTAALMLGVIMLQRINKMQRVLPCRMPICRKGLRLQKSSAICPNRWTGGKIICRIREKKT